MNTLDDITEGSTNKYMSATEKTKLSGIEALADVTDAGNVASSIHGVANKATPVDNDEVGLIDSAASNALKRTLWSDIKATLKTYFDTLYSAVSHTHAWASLTSKPTTLSGAGITDAMPLAGGTFTGAVALSADPASALQPATKQYVDGLLANVGKRARVRAATTANITISTALNNGDSLDGITLATGDQVLVKNQSSAAENGVYVVGVSPARAVEFDSWAEHPGSLVAVEEGSTNADTLWLCTSNDGGTLGSTSLAFSKMVIAGELLAANNLSDVANAGTALTNLGVTAAAQTVLDDTTVAAMLATLGAGAVVAGTWTPSLGGTATYTSRTGTYLTITAPTGEIEVFFSGQMAVNAIGTGSQVNISGLPISQSGTQLASISVGFFSGLATNVVFLSGTVGGTSISLRGIAAAGVSMAGLNVLTSGSTIYFSGHYKG